MKTQRRKAADAQSEELNFAPSPLGGAVLNTSAPASAPREEAELPEGWRWSPISAIARTFTGGTPSREHPEYFGGSIKWVKSGDLNDGVLRDTEETISDEGLAKSNAKKCQPGTLLVALYGATTGKVALLDIEAATNQAICALEPNAAADSPFLMYALAHRRSALLVERYGGAQPNISQTVLRAFELPLPPLPEQRAIAEALRTVQGAKEACERVLATTRQLKQSLLQHLFTYGPVPFAQAAHVPRDETDVGALPAGWRVEPFESVLLGGTQNGIYKSRESYGNGSPIADMTDVFRADVLSGQMERLNLTTEELTKYRLKENDLLFARRSFKVAGSGKCQLVESLREPTVFSSSIIRAAPDPRQAHSRYLLYFFTSPFGRSVMARIIRQLAVSGITGSDLKRLPIPIPSVCEQREIAAQLAAVDAKLAAEESRRSALAALFQSLLHYLMTGKVRLPEFVQA